MAGRFGGVARLTGCVDCEPGQFQGSVAGTECETCAAGLFSSSRVSTACVACEPGKFSPTARLSSCSLCAPGYFQTNFSGALILVLQISAMWCGTEWLKPSGPALCYGTLVRDCV